MGIDDSPFTRTDVTCSLIGVLMRLDFYIEGFVSAQIQVDGSDSEKSVMDLITSRLGQSANVVMTNGITFGGFNLIDPARIAELACRPVITITKKMPDVETMKAAISKHLQDDDKIRILDRLRPERIVLKSGKTLYCNYNGISAHETKRILEKTIKQGSIPEPLRMAHLVGRFLRFGSSS